MAEIVYDGTMKFCDRFIGVRSRSHDQMVQALCFKENRSYSTYRSYIESSPPETAANALVCIIHQANFLLDQQLRSLEKGFVDEGWFTERLYRVRTQAPPNPNPELRDYSS